MKKFLIFTAFFALGACVLLGGAIIVSDLMRGQNAYAETAYIETSATALEPAAGANTAPSDESAAPPPAADADLMPVTATPQGAAVEDIAATHPLLRLTPDKTEMVRLEREAGSVIVGNPDNLSVLTESPRLLLFVPQRAGATHVTVLDREGAILMQRHVVVAAPKEKYVRIRRSCANASRQGDCQPVTVYYCPDMCHEVSADSRAGRR